MGSSGGLSGNTSGELSGFKPHHLHLNIEGHLEHLCPFVRLSLRPPVPP